MKSVLFFLLAIICGGGAFFANYIYLQRKTETVAYLVAGKDIKQGETIEASALKSIELPSLAQTTALKKGEAAVIMQRPARRALRQGELIFADDAATVDSRLQLAKNERGLILSIADLSLEVGLIELGSQVGFIIRDDANNTFRPIGPYRVIAIGASKDSWQLAAQEVDTITVAATIDTSGELDSKTLSLVRADSGSQIQSVMVWGDDS